MPRRLLGLGLRQVGPLSGVALVMAALAGLVALVVRPQPGASASMALEKSATVLSIGDGDSLQVRFRGQVVTVRLACIDAPELAQQPWGARARGVLQRRLPIGTPLTLAIRDRDRYGRLVAEVIRGGRNINLILVEDGQAFAYRRHLERCDAEAYLEAETRARRKRVGLWQVNGGITRPWIFRGQARTGARS